ncbi:sulfurtransferase complex subunit TusC [Moritella sp. Urea-trap-13]|uniref:sulfurtransferase complex subunit TusC n=1 Tax=Moritella sp. Urea-trap-13 TaxID=2058327 RepID=UPI000C32C579|nr:sulfurtransferase complex subunit TusC [Moritella sp. Urea-trap-13]PKH09090.1 sulfurtransferase complex subunit TusC [Moritella sp. Urea-trap-13]
MLRAAFVTRQVPHGTSLARETQDAILATSALTEELSVFFIGDGVYQLMANQKPQDIACRDFAPTFGMFELYDIENIYVCADSLLERGIGDAELIIDAQHLSQPEINQHIRQHAIILNF